MSYVNGQRESRCLKSGSQCQVILTKDLVLKQLELLVLRAFTIAGDKLIERLFVCEFMEGNKNT
jgi:hypothetical protein